MKEMIAVPYFVAGVKVGRLALFLFVTLLWGGVLSLSNVVQAQGLQRIAAVVNDDIITLRDMEARIFMIIGTSNLPNTAETRQRLRPQVLRKLIIEKLKLQEAARQGVSITQADLDRGVSGIEKQNKMSPGSFQKLMADRGIDPQTSLDQLRSDMSWFKVIRRTIEPKVTIGDEEINNVLSSMRSNLGRPQHQMAEILLTVDSPRREREISNLAQRLVQQIRGGASFPSLARQFSQSPTAALGGDMGWVFEGQLPAELDAVIKGMQPGQVEGPIRTTAGFYIIALRNRRAAAAGQLDQIKFTLSQLYMPVDGADAVSADRRAEILTAAQEAKSCDQLDALAVDLELGGSGSIGTLTAAELPQAMRGTVMNLPEKKPSPLVQVRGGYSILMVCKREEPNILPSRDQIRENLKRQRVDMLARRRLRDLRRRAFVDVRM